METEACPRFSIEMTPDFSQDHFELLRLAVKYAVDPARLERGYRDLQSQVRPDRFASATQAERRVAMQWATRANEAFRTLKDPVERARYLLELKGYDTEEESNTAMAPDFLMQQMEWREAVADARAARDAGKLARVRGDIAQSRSEMLPMLGLSLHKNPNFHPACSPPSKHPASKLNPK